MKQFALFIIAVFIYFSGFSQTLTGSTSFQDNSTFKAQNVQIEAKVYPNPCKNQRITVEFKSKEISEIHLTNIAGKEVLYKKLQFPTNKKIIQLEDIPNGIYLIRIKSTDNKQVVKKLIVSFH